MFQTLPKRRTHEPPRTSAPLPIPDACAKHLHPWSSGAWKNRWNMPHLKNSMVATDRGAFATIQPPTQTRPKLCWFSSARWHLSTPVGSNFAVSVAMVGFDCPDLHEKYFPNCLRNHWLEDASRTGERRSVTFCKTISIGLACSTTSVVFQISMHEVHVDALPQCQKTGIRRFIFASCLFAVTTHYPASNNFQRCCNSELPLLKEGCSSVWFTVPSRTWDQGNVDGEPRPA